MYWSSLWPGGGTSPIVQPDRELSSRVCLRSLNVEYRLHSFCMKEKTENCCHTSPSTVVGGVGVITKAFEFILVPVVSNKMFI